MSTLSGSYDLPLLNSGSMWFGESQRDHSSDLFRNSNFSPVDIAVIFVNSFPPVSSGQNSSAVEVEDLYRSECVAMDFVDDIRDSQIDMDSDIKNALSKNHRKFYF